MHPLFNRIVLAVLLVPSLQLVARADESGIVAGSESGKPGAKANPTVPAPNAIGLAPRFHPEAQATRSSGLASLDATVQGILRANAQGLQLDVHGILVTLTVGQPSSEFASLLNQGVVVHGRLNIAESVGKSPSWTCAISKIMPAPSTEPNTTPSKPASLQHARPEVGDAKNDDKDGNNIFPLVEGIRQSGEAIVAYRPGRSEQAKAVCVKAGLIIKETYGPGHFLVCRWEKGLELEPVIKTLLASSAIEYVEPNGKQYTVGSANTAPAAGAPQKFAPRSSPAAPTSPPPSAPTSPSVQPAVEKK
jgi:hypothetical protein